MRRWAFDGSRELDDEWQRFLLPQGWNEIARMERELVARPAACYRLRVVSRCHGRLWLTVRTLIVRESGPVVAPKGAIELEN